MVKHNQYLIIDFINMADMFTILLIVRHKCKIFAILFDNFPIYCVMCLHYLVVIEW